MTTATEGRHAVTAEWLAERVAGRSITELSSSVAGLIAQGVLAPGSQLPTIRDVARTLRVGVGTVAEAWSALRESGLVETRRRGGTLVTGQAESGAVARSSFAGWSHVDLIQTSPDISLQPSLGDALLSSLDAPNLNAWGREYMTERLARAVEPDWPFPAEAWATAGGGTEALLLAIAAAAPPGSLVAVDEPVGPGVLDTLKELGVTPIGVSADAEGPTPQSLRAALAQSPVAFVFQPGGPFSLAHVATAARTAELAEVIGEHLDGSDEQLWIIEDDSIGPLAAATPPTLGADFPERTLRIRSYCKAYGIDVRTSVMAGSSELIDRAMAQRSHGVGSNSRILQNTLAYLIGDARTAERVRLARAAYASRRVALLAALQAHGLTATAGPDSLLVWVEVPHETETVLSLAARGVTVAPGGMSFVSPQERGLIRISVTQLPDDARLVDGLAELVAKAAQGRLRGFFD